MKIPEKVKIPRGGATTDAWYTAATKEGLRTGVYVSVKITMRPDNEYISELQFEVMEHLFGSLPELKRALNNKTFL
jgi:hypothetical protein